VSLPTNGATRRSSLTVTLGSSNFIIDIDGAIDELRISSRARTPINTAGLISTIAGIIPDAMG